MSEGASSQPSEPPIIAAMRAALKQAMKDRDQVSVRALRPTLAAIANAEAPSAEGVPTDVYGSIVQHDRLVLTPDDVVAIVQAEADDRRATIELLRKHGRDEDADALAEELAVIERHLAASRTTNG